MNIFTTIRLISLLSTIPYAFSQPPCKIVQSLEDNQFDLDMFISKKWYSHQQIPSAFNPVEIFYCVTAEYSLLDPSNPIDTQPLANGYSVKVLNTAKDVDGNVFTSDDPLLATGGPAPGPLCAGSFTDGKVSEITVNFCPLPAAGISSNYWVVAYDEDDGMALIAGGQTNIPTENGLCKYASPFAGVWIFSRSPERNEAMIQKYRNIAMNDNGIDLSSLADVSHNKSCKHGKKSKKSKKSKVPKATKGEGWEE
jgi:hypothetical protein